jgi:hypothetical protein
MGAQEFALSSHNVNAMALQILEGLDSRKIPRYADEMDPLDVVGENTELQHEQAIEKREAESYSDFKTPLTSTIVARSKDETQLFESECVGRIHDRGTARGDERCAQSRRG